MAYPALRVNTAVIIERQRIDHTSAVAAGPTWATTAPDERYCTSGTAVAATACCQMAARMLLDTPTIGLARKQRNHHVCRSGVTFLSSLRRIGNEEMREMEMSVDMSEMMLNSQED